MNNEGKYNKKIEYLRIVCINMIILYHLGCMTTGDSFFIKLFTFSSLRLWMAVDVFFALSGYYFYLSITNKYKEPIRYIKNRVQRIVPGYYAFLIFYFTLGIPIQRFFGNDFTLPNNYYWIHFFTFTANIPMAFGTWSGVALEGFFGLCILVQLLILFTFLFSFFKKTKHRILILVLIEILAIVLRSLSIFQTDEWASYFFTLTRVDGFIIGAILAILKTNERTEKVLNENKVKIFLFSLIPLCLILPMTNILDVHNSYTARYGFPLIALSIFGLLNFILSLKDDYSSFHAGKFVYSIFLVRLPIIYLFIGISRYFKVQTITTSTITLIVTYMFLLLWGRLFQPRRKKWITV